MMHWAAKYIGLRYELGGRTASGVDCWGLLRLIYQHEKDITLPMLPGVTELSLLCVAREINERLKEHWIEILQPVDGCAVAMGRSEALLHVGVWADVDGGKVVHSWEGKSVVAETIRMLRVKGIRTIKFFTYGLHNRDKEPVRTP